jgi:hypothetical protein
MKLVTDMTEATVVKTDYTDEFMASFPPVVRRMLTLLQLPPTELINLASEATAKQGGQSDRSQSGGQPPT